MEVHWFLYAVELIVMTAVFTGMILIPLCRDPVWWIHDYPKDIQEEYFKHHERIPTDPLSSTVVLKKGFAIVLAVAVLTGLAALAGARSFPGAFVLSYGIWLAIDWYDCFVLDWVFFANIRRIRLPGTEHMDRAYHQKKYHVVHSAAGMALGLIPCLLCGCIIELLSCF